MVAIGLESIKRGNPNTILYWYRIVSTLFTLYLI